MKQPFSLRSHLLFGTVLWTIGLVIVASAALILVIESHHRPSFAFIDAVNRFVPAPARRDDQDGNGQTSPAPAAEHRQAVHARQSQVENDRVILLGPCEKVGALAVGGAVDRIARSGQRVRKLL